MLQQRSSTWIIVIIVACIALCVSSSVGMTLFASRLAEEIRKNVINKPYESAIAWLQAEAPVTSIVVVKQGFEQSLAMSAETVYLIVDQAGIVRDTRLDGSGTLTHSGVVKTVS